MKKINNNKDLRGIVTIVMLAIFVQILVTIFFKVDVAILETFT
ncbi:hypothetical protein [Anaeromicrobium sediminis]|nr:hypothetical protein [Anaeromicrobium sediminis]